MKLFTKLFNILAIILCLTFISYAQTNWVGEYFFGEDGGKTAGGSKIYIAHTIKITEKDGKLDAHIYSQGFQTSRDIYADVKTEGNKIMFHFREKGEDDVRGSYEKGDLLLTLERTEVDGKTKILTSWGTFSPTLESNEKSGEVYFELSSNTSKEQKDNSKEWMHIEVKNKKLSLSFPADSLINTESKNFTIYGFENGVTMNLSVYKGLSKNNLKKMIVENPRNVKDYKIGDYLVRQMSNSNIYDGFSQTLIIASKKEYYSVFVTSPFEMDKITQRFLMSVKIDGKPLFTSSNENTPQEKNVQIENLKTSPEVLEALKRKTERTDRKIDSQIGAVIDKKDLEEIVKFSRPVFIMDLPRPNFPSSLPKLNGFVYIRLQVEFLANGQVGDITIINSFNETIAKECCVDAVKKIKFVPAQINGENVNAKKVVSYSFQTVINFD